MRRLLRAALAVTVALAALTATRLSLPDGVAACSCVPPVPGAPVFGDEAQAVLVGTAGAPDRNGAVWSFTVERWFKGGTERVARVASANEVLADGTVMINTCGLSFEAGERMLLAASVSDGVLQPNNCGPNARLGTPDGQRLLAAAIEQFGEGTPPQGTDTGDPPDDGVQIGGLALAAVGALVLAIVLVVVAAAWRGRGEGRGEGRAA